jgi:hypothetical protein
MKILANISIISLMHCYAIDDIDHPLSECHVYALENISSSYNYNIAYLKNYFAYII